MSENPSRASLKSKDDCGVCGKPLVYEAEETTMLCEFCLEPHSTNARCPDGHYVCDSCHRREALDILRQVLRSSTSTDPAGILETVMSHPSVPMHGPEHHGMVPAVIVTAAANAGYPLPRGAAEQAIARGSKVPGGWCGFCGACGAGIGVGIAVSVLTQATPLTGEQRSLAIEAASLALSRMVDGYPRCCKRASRTALEAAVEFLRDRMGIDLESGERVSCAYSTRNRECARAGCPYYADSVAQRGQESNLPGAGKYSKGGVK